MRRVIIESPYRGKNQAERLRNISYLKRCLRDSLLRNEAPFASHGLYPGALDEDRPEERSLAIEAGFEWSSFGEAIIFYTDYGWSPGMLAAQRRAFIMQISIEVRTLNADNQNSQPKPE